jgi:hypothetical protein
MCTGTCTVGTATPTKGSTFSVNVAGASSCMHTSSHSPRVLLTLL